MTHLAHRMSNIICLLDESIDNNALFLEGLMRHSFEILNDNRQRVKEYWSDCISTHRPEKLAFYTVLNCESVLILTHFTNLNNFINSPYFNDIFRGHIPEPQCYRTPQAMADWIDSYNLYAEKDGEGKYRYHSRTLYHYSQFLRNGSQIDEFIRALGHRIWKQLTEKQMNIFRQVVFTLNIEFFILPQIEREHYEYMCGNDLTVGTDEDWGAFVRDPSFKGFDVFGVTVPFDKFTPDRQYYLHNLDETMTRWVTLYDFGTEGVAIKTRNYFRFLIWPDEYEDMMNSL